MTNKDVFIADILLKASLGWQELVDHAPTLKAKQAAGQEACIALAGINGYFGTRKILVKSETALMFSDGYQEGDLWSAIQFRGLLAKGWLGRVNYVSMNGHGTLTWPIYDAQVINTEEVEICTDDELPPDDEHRLPTDRIRRPIHFPVGVIDYALCAA